MARPRKPTNMLALTGAFKINPKRAVARKDEPAPVGEIGEAPDHLLEAERKAWAEIVGLCHKGTLCAADKLVIEHGARVLAALRAMTEYTDVRLMVRLEAVLGRLGLTPADRSRVSATKPKAQDDGYDEFRSAG